MYYLGPIANVTLLKDLFDLASKSREVEVLTNSYDRLSNSYISPKLSLVNVLYKPCLALRTNVGLTIVLVVVVVL